MNHYQYHDTTSSNSSQQKQLYHQQQQQQQLQLQLQLQTEKKSNYNKSYNNKTHSSSVRLNCLASFSSTKSNTNKDQMIFSLSNNYYFIPCRF